MASVPHSAFDSEVVSLMRQDGCSWATIAKSMDVDVRTLYRWRKAVGDVRDSRNRSVDGNEVRRLREMGFSWQVISRKLSVSYDALRYWRESSGFKEPLVQNANITDEELDAIISYECINQRQRGERMHTAALLSAGLSVTRKRIRESLHRVDPEAI
jgi:DNA invertase Pin-like site-specific DNA recombinase